MSLLQCRAELISFAEHRAASELASMCLEDVLHSSKALALLCCPLWQKSGSVDTVLQLEPAQAADSNAG